MRKHHLNEELTAMSDNFLLAAGAIRKVPQYALHLDKFHSQAITQYSFPVAVKGYHATQRHSIIAADILTWLAVMPPSEHFQFKKKYDQEGNVTREQYSAQIFPLIPYGTYTWDFLFGQQWIDHDSSVKGAVARLKYASTLDNPHQYFSDLRFNPEMYKHHLENNRCGD